MSSTFQPCKSASSVSIMLPYQPQMLTKSFKNCDVDIQWIYYPSHSCKDHCWWSYEKSSKSKNSRPQMQSEEFWQICWQSAHCSSNPEANTLKICQNYTCISYTNPPKNFTVISIPNDWVKELVSTTHPSKRWAYIIIFRLPYISARKPHSRDPQNIPANLSRLLWLVCAKSW